MKLSGACLCGNVKFECACEPNWIATCHCESCRKNTASPFTTFFGINNGKFSYLNSKPAEYLSSNGVIRYHCDNCGTPIAFYSEKWPHEVHFYVSSLENPNELQPEFHVHWAEKLDWVKINDALPKYPGSADDGL